ncbi:HlyD family type I secretion periplasmic adaptor subunit [Xanthomonas hyacinthi]|uniref:Membrane fusion protein (MFP) family protein n=1 Tax=Xanthomonas hyacinthi TaxID=56455 RepID=A0A2S7ENR8_9XANT|nr:HlyD family type I secretion periplasmic adaptor subunit [Xanthomonas hyacinthi]KLD78346.1 hemolysin secretion protein D [Xanthomonas hyacinthi DSM 19077]PPU93428.1 HlyD family type I secretion periplasmic adaptor subunit [Xanthomonas hyacinthi]QGY78870.1 HlyD family type I secretion periplasmic adaptor subunit [Xanthomonas hyacinthi]
MKHLWEAAKEFLGRYRQAFGAAWKIRQQLDPPKRTEDELAFLPAQLELIESPVSPTARWTARIIMALFVVALLWAVIGKLDIVAVAPGKTVVGSRTKVIQPAETAVVRQILVRDGQVVKQGDLLVELDATATGAEYQQADESLISGKLAELRYGAMVQALESSVLSQTPPVSPGLTEDQVKATWQLTSSEFASFQAQQQRLETTIEQQQAQAQTVLSQIDPLQRSLDIARERVADMERLLGSQYVSKHEYLARKQEMVEMERLLAVQRASVVESQSAIAGAREELRVLVADTRQKTYDGLRQAREQIGQYAPQVVKTEQRNQLMQLRAPVDGTVQQLAIHTVGGVVTPAQELMLVVPSEELLEVEATVLNKDIGFVRPGQLATVKVESFPYTRYGYLTGIVETVSHDAAQDENMGLIFPARVKLSQAHLVIDGVRVALTPGMSLSVEIKTGKRRVIDYLLSPLQQHGAEALRER